ncbi:MAG: hypothetical protein ACOYKD_09550 [Anaerolineaceae bacterium]|jgi:hypothetical protein
MRAHRLKPFALVCLLLLAACQSGTGQTPEAPLKPLSIGISPELSFVTPALSACSSHLEQYGVVLNQLPAPELNVLSADLVFTLDRLTGAEPFVTSPVSLPLALLANPGVPVPALSLTQVQAVLSGEITHWDQIDPSQAEHLPVRILRYPDEHELSIWLHENFLGSEIILAGEVLYYQEQFEEELKNQAGSVALVIDKALPQDLTRITILDDQNQPISWQIPLLILSASEPAGEVAAFLQCLQTELQAQ